MTIKILISSAIVSAIITVIGNIITSKISQEAAIEAAKKAACHEIDKMERTWEREDIVSSDDEFAEMAKAVAKFIDYSTCDNQQDAIGRVAAIRSKESGELGCALDNLYSAVKQEDTESANQYLTEAIEKKRALKLARCSENRQV